MAYLLLLFTVLFWSGNWVLGRAIRAEIPPLALGFWRWVLAMACLLPWAWRPLWQQRQELRRHWLWLCVFGLLGGAANSSMTYVALSMTTATNSILLASSSPIMIIALSWALFGKRLRAIEWAGVVVSLSGVLIIVARGELQTLLALQMNRGDLWILLGLLSWALYTALLARRPISLHPYAFLFAMGCTGLLTLAPFYAWEIASGHVLQATPTTFASIAYAGIFSTLLAFTFWNRAVSIVGGNTAGQFMNLMPAMGTLLAIIILGEQPRLFQLVGIALILGGVTLTTRQSRF